MMRDTDPESILNRKKAAKYLDVAPGTLAVWDFTKRYDLKPIKVGRAVRYRRADLDWFFGRTTKTLKPPKKSPNT